MNVIEQLRQYAIEHVMGVKSMSSGWQKRKEQILDIVGDPPDPNKVIKLGEQLSDIFKIADSTGRGQGTVSAAGTVWECLVCWYCNICMIGSRVVFIKYKKDLIPKPFRNAMTVTYGNVSTTSEADLIVLVFPDRKEYVQERPNPSKKQFMQDLNDMAEEHFKEYEMGIVQCKTNWNDISQIPMLWDIIYKIQDPQHTGVIVGTEGYKISTLKRFTYSFVTVPTNDWKTYRSDQLRVRRLTNLSGSNYWGYPSKSGVANSIMEIFNRNFEYGFTGRIVDHIRVPLQDIRGRYSYFGL